MDWEDAKKMLGSYGPWPEDSPPQLIKQYVLILNINLNIDRTNSFNSIILMGKTPCIIKVKL